MRDTLLQIYTNFAANNPLGNADDLNIPGTDATTSNLDKIINLLFVAAGGLALIFVIVGGVMYIFSSGNPDATKRARNIVLYALAGLAITILAYAIVNLVIGLSTGEEVKTL